MTNFNYTPTIPDGPNNPSVDQPGMKINAQSIKDILAVDHVTFSADNGGTHKQVTFSSDNTPSLPTPTDPLTGNKIGILFTQPISAINQLFYYAGDDIHSSKQYTLASNGSILLFGGIIMKWATINTNTTYNLDGSGSNPLNISAFSNNAFGAVSTNSQFGNNNPVLNSQLTLNSIRVTGSSSFTVFVIMLGN